MRTPASGHGNHSGTRAHVRKIRKVKILAGGSLSALIVNSTLALLNRIPEDMQVEFHGAMLGTSVLAGLYLAHLLLPRRFKVTVEWNEN